MVYKDWEGNFVPRSYLLANGKLFDGIYNFFPIKDGDIWDFWTRLSTF